MNNHDLAVAIYARVSSDQQAENGTIHSQVQAVLERVAQDGLSVDEAMRFVDEGYSGATLVRPALERLRDLAATGAIDRLYVHCPDRLARKYAYQVLLVEELQRCGVELVLLNQALGQSAEDDLLLQVQGMLAEYERAKIMERSRRGKRHAASRGSINVLGKAPYGYRYISKDQGNGEAHFDVVFAEATVVRQIFEWVGRERLSIGEVIRRLEKQGIASPKGKGIWHSAAVWKMLKNPAYKGEAAFGKTRSGPYRRPLRPHRGQPAQPRRSSTAYPRPKSQWISIAVPPIVSQELFEAVQEQLQENRKRARARRQGARHLLQGLLVCERCGYALCAYSYRRPREGERQVYGYYRCTGRDAHRCHGERLCENGPVRMKHLDESVWADVCEVLSDPKQIEQEYERRLSMPSMDGSWPGEPQLKQQVQKVKQGMARITDAYEHGWLDASEFERRIVRAKQRHEQLAAQLEAIADQNKQRRDLRLVIGHLEDFGQRVGEGLRTADFSTRRDIIRALVKEIQVGDSIKLVYRIDPPPSAQEPVNTVLRHCCRRIGVGHEKPDVEAAKRKGRPLRALLLRLRFLMRAKHVLPLRGEDG